MKYRLFLVGLSMLTFGTACQAQLQNPPKFRPSHPLFQKRSIVAELKQQIVQKEHQRRLALREYTPTSFKIRSIDAEISALRHALKRVMSDPNRPAPPPKFQLLSRKNLI